MKLIMNAMGGILAANRETHSITLCVKQALESCALEAWQLPQLSLDLKDDFKFRGHRKLITFVIYTLVKYVYTTAGNACAIRIWLDRPQSSVHIRNDGPGMDEEEVAQLWESPTNPTMKEEALILPFCKATMERYGGNIFCQSRQGSNAYTEFILEFFKIKLE